MAFLRLEKKGFFFFVGGTLGGFSPPESLLTFSLYETITVAALHTTFCVLASKPNTAVITAITKFAEIAATEPSCNVHVAAFAAETLLMNMPDADWPRGVDLFTMLRDGSSWPSKCFPPSNHVVWAWLRCFLTPRSLAVVPSESLLEDIKAFVSLVMKWNLLDHLAPANFCQDFQQTPLPRVREP